MNITHISTKEVAALLNVTETTIKRWTDSNSIKCIKTLGGHRKYRLNDIEEFAKKNNIPLSGITAPLDKEQMQKLSYGVYSKKIDDVIEIILEESLQGDREGMLELLVYLIKNGFKFVNLVDEIIQPALKKIGDLWEEGQLEIGQEHLASDTIKTAVSRLVVQLHHQKAKNIKVICACSEGELHDIGLETIAYELELNGFNPVFMGSSTPFSSVIKFIKKEKPKFVLISATSPSISEKEFIKGIKSISKTAKETKALLLLGGIYAQKFEKDKLGCDAIVDSIKETFSFIKKNNQ